MFQLRCVAALALLLAAFRFGSLFAQLPASLAPHKGADGDPLPAGSLARLGTLRFRQGSAILTVALTRDGRTAASVGRDGTIRLWEVATGRELRRFSVGPAQATGLAFAPDGKRLAATGGNGNARLWDVASGRLLREFPKGCGPVTFSHDGLNLIAGFGENGVCVWETATGKELLRTAKHRRAVVAVAFSADDKAVLSAGSYEDRTIRFHELATGKERGQPVNHQNNIQAFALSPDGRTLAIAGYFPALQLRDAATGKVIRTLDGGKTWCRSVAFTPDGRGVVSGAEDGAVRLWDAHTGKELRRFAGLRNAVNGITLSANGKVLIAGGADRVLRAWDAANGNALGPTDGHAHRVTALHFAADGKTLTSAARDPTVRAWDLASGKELRRRDGPANGTGATYLSPDGKTAACVVHDGIRGSLHVWGAEVRTAKVEVRPDTSMAFSADGKRLVAAGNGGAVLVWDLASLELRHRLAHPRIVPRSVACSPDGKLLASLHESRASESGGLRNVGLDRVVLWDAAAGKKLHEIPVHLVLNSGPLAFAPDGRTVAGLDTRRRMVLLWETATGKERRGIWFGTPPGRAGWTSYYQEDLISALAISPGGRLLALGLEHKVYVWDAATGAELRQFTGHEGKVAALAFSPDGKALASAGDDTTILLWDVAALPAGRAGGERLSAEVLEALWAQLRRDTAGEAMARLVQAPKQATALLRAKLRPVLAPQPAQLARLFAGLESARFKEREAATRRLEEFAELIEPALRQRLAGQPAEEVRRRLGQLLDRLRADSAEQMRQARAVEVLEHIGSPAARKVLQALASGAPQARLTREAQASRERLDKRPSALP